MKKYISRIIMLVAVALSFSAAADAQIRVRIRPTIIIGTRPPPPSPRHVWVGGEWNPNGDRYDYREGYWSEPQSRYRKRYRQGHWQHNRRGYVWVPGRWR
jgi:WXXGXW repeat (2 copies)